MSYLDGCIELTKEELRLVNGGTSDFKIESSLSDNGHEMGNGYMQYKAQIDRTNAEIDANRASGTGTGSGSGSGTGGSSGSGSGSNSGSGNSGNSTGTDTSAAGNNSSTGTGTGSEPSFYGYNPNMITPENGTIQWEQISETDDGRDLGNGFMQYKDKVDAMHRSNYQGVPTDVRELLNKHKRDERLNSIFSSTVAQLKGTDYVLGGNGLSGVDCSGTVYYGLTQMGVDVERPTVATLTDENNTYVNFVGCPSDKIAGEAGVLNFYKIGSTNYTHVNIGIDTTEVPLSINNPMKQIIDATEGVTMNCRNDGRDGQYYTTTPGSVNQTYAPFSSNTPVSQQGFINWDEVIKSVYEGTKL